MRPVGIYAESATSATSNVGNYDERSERLVLNTRHQRPDSRVIHLLDRDGSQVRAGEEGRKVEIGLEANVDRERGDRALQSRHDWIGAAEVIEDDDPAAGTAYAEH